MRESATQQCSTVPAEQFDYTGGPQTFTASRDGYYEIELWGAQGYSGTLEVTGEGAYTKGILYLTEGMSLYVYVGEEGING
jgi:hypothetical protein